MSSPFPPQAVYTRGSGTTTLSGPIISTVDPTSSNVIGPGGPFQLGQEWINTLTDSIWFLTGLASAPGSTVATWSIANGGSSNVDTINGLVPLGGDIVIAGTADQIGVSNAGHTVTLSLTGPYAPSTYTAHGVLVGEGTGSIVALGVGVTNSVLQGSTGANPAFTTAPSVVSLTATSGNISATAGQVNAGASMHAGTTVTAGTGITSTTGNITASTGNLVSTLGSVSAATTVTAGTGVTATTGDFTATNGNLALNTVGNKLLIKATSSATCSAGTFVLGGGATTVVPNTAVTASSIILLTTQALGTVAVASTLAVTGITPTTNFTVTPSVAADTSTIAYLIIN